MKTCIYDINSHGKNYFADVWEKNGNYYLGIVDPDNKQNNGIFSIFDGVYERLIDPNYDCDFDSLHKLGMPIYNNNIK